MHRPTYTIAIAVLFLSRATGAPPEPERVERIVALGKLWIAVKYFHPYLAYREDIDWDKALVDAIPKVSAADNSDEYRAAVEGMLAALHDPATHVLAAAAPRADPPGGNRERDPRFHLTNDGILEVRINHYQDLTDFSGTRQKLADITKEIVKARDIVFDLRGDAPLDDDTRGMLAYGFQSGSIQGSLTESSVAAPGERLRMHVGFATQVGGTSGGYTSGFYVTDGERINPAEKSQAKPIVFLVNQDSELPPVALALQGAGKAVVVAEGGANDASVVTTQQISLVDGVTAQVRLGESVYEDGTGGFAADLTVPPSSLTGGENPAWKRAIEIVRDFKPYPTARRPLPARAAPPSEKKYAEMTYPPAEYRLLAVFRLWAAINYFHPYRDLMGEDWDAILRAFVPRMEKADSGLKYVQVLAEMGTHIHDGHVSVTSKILREYLGVAGPPFGVRMIEGLPVVTRIDDDAVAKEAGLEIGDIILKVDGEDAGARMARLAQYQATSTPQMLGLVVSNRMLRGPDKSTATLTIRDAHDQVREVKLPRSASYEKWAFDAGRTGDIFRILPGNVGYVDLERLTRPMVDEMFEKLKDTMAIIFDDRDYPKGTAWAIAPRLTEKSHVGAALFQRRVATSPDGANGELLNMATTQTFTQQLPATSAWRYKGKTVMLMDERTISQAEHTGLFFEAANGTKFIGSPTAGANGDVTSVVLPGDVAIWFTGQSVRHADGRQLQRVGLTPDVPVTPTIAGIRSGRDEVLEKAIEYLNDQLK